MGEEGKKFPHRKSKCCLEPSSLNAFKNSTEEALIDELERLKRKVGLGGEVKVRWFPGISKEYGGRVLLEEVKGDTIFIYAEDEGEALKLVSHGFAEWLMNRNTERYRLFINKLIELFEQIQYKEKEKIVDALARLMIS